MHVLLEQRGGFVGSPMFLEVTTNTLTGEEDRHLRKVIAAARFFTLPGSLPAPITDNRLRFKLTIDDETQSHTVQFDECAVYPLMPRVMELVDAIYTYASEIRGGTVWQVG